MHKVYILPILHPILKKSFQYSLERQYLILSFHSAIATTPLEHDVFICILTKGHMCQLDAALYLSEQISWYLHTLCINNANNI